MHCHSLNSTHVKQTITLFSPTSTLPTEFVCSEIILLVSKARCLGVFPTSMTFLCLVSVPLSFIYLQPSSPRLSLSNMTHLLSLVSHSLPSTPPGAASALCFHCSLSPDRLITITVMGFSTCEPCFWEILLFLINPSLTPSSHSHLSLGRSFMSQLSGLLLCETFPCLRREN